MNVFLAATMRHHRNLREIIPDVDFRQIYTLESFYYMREKKKEDYSWCANSEKFLLDSGAFTFMQKGGGCTTNAKWLRYADEYADFIREYDIKYYFELDIDSIKGLKYAEMLRERIENRSGKKSIPVWHVERGKDYFIDMVKEYSYVALGNLAKVMPGSVTIKDKYLPWFINTARTNGVRIHGLGYTANTLSKIHFNSVDSSSWMYGNMSGFLYEFDAQKGVMKHIRKKEGQKLGLWKDVLAHNFKEWVKFQKYAETHF